MILPQAITTSKAGHIWGIPFMHCTDQHTGMDLGSHPNTEPTEGSQRYASRKTTHPCTFSQMLNVDATMLLYICPQRILSSH